MASSSLCRGPSRASGAFWSVCVFCVLAVAAGGARAIPPEGEVQHEFNIIAGNAFFDASPVLGVVCTFDFGDPAGAYNVLTGFNAAHIYRNPGNYTLKVKRHGAVDSFKTIHVLPDQRAIQTLGPGDSIGDVIKALRNDTIVLLPPGSTWEVTRPLVVNVHNIEFRSAGPGPAPRFRRVRGTGYATFELRGLNITFRGIEFDSDQEMKIVGNKKIGHRGVTVEAANVLMIDCTFRNLADAVYCTPLTRNLLVQWCHFTDEVRGCDAWIDGANVSLLGNKMATSQHEHNCRSSGAGFHNLLLYENDLTATHGKETLTFRIGQDLYAAHNAFHGWVRVGDGPHPDFSPMTADELRKKFVRYAVIEDNAFLDGAWMQINEGSSKVMFRDNRIHVNTEQVAIAVQGPSLADIWVEDNVRVLTAGPTSKPFIVYHDTGPNDVSERGTTTVEGDSKPEPGGNPKSESPKSESPKSE